MTSNQTSTTADAPPVVPSLADGAARLASAVELLQGADRFIAKALQQLGEVIGTGACEVSWGQVRNICLKASRMSRDDRAILDGRLAATVERWGGLDGFHPDAASR